MATTRLIENEGGAQCIGRYELIAEIASGGMATVYLARLSGVGGFQRNVAIKCLHPHLARDAEFVEMFLDEARLAASIHHPNVVPILEVGEDPGGYFLVMDYVEGDTFAALLSRAALDGKDVPREISLRILVDMLSGLRAAHELEDEHGKLLGLVHRDVSPQNILIGTDGVTRITDFGVARAASRLSATRAGQLKGKLAYMAPEQASGEEAIDLRADIFSAGVVLWEALAQKRLFKASNEAATLARVLNDPIVSPAELSSEVPEEVARVCLKALERDVALRYSSCGEFADELERAAGRAGCLATSREVAAYVQTVVGEALESQRHAIRSWLQRRGRATESSMPSIRAPGFQPPPPSRRPPSSGPLDTSTVVSTPEGRLQPPPSVLSSRLAYHPPRAAGHGAPAGLVGAPASAPGSTTPVSLKHSSSPPTLLSTDLVPAPSRRRWIWLAAGLLALGAALALFLEPDVEPRAAGSDSAGAATGQVGSTAVGSELVPSAAAPAAASDLTTASGTPAASGAAPHVSSAAASGSGAAQKSAAPQPQDETQPANPRRWQRRTPADEPAKPKSPKPKLPDLDNPYQ